MEKKQKQTIERLEQDHTSRLRDEAKRIKADQDKELSKFQNMLKNRKKEVKSGMEGAFALGREWSARALLSETGACVLTEGACEKLGCV